MIGTITIDGKVYAIRDDSDQAAERITAAIHNTFKKFSRPDSLIDASLTDNNGTLKRQWCVMGDWSDRLSDNGTYKD